MGKIFYILGKSATGKDTIYKKLLEDKSLNLKEIVLYTTRPIRDSETDGSTYHFVSESDFLRLKEAGRVIEDRVYNTVHGPWRYFTVDDENIDLEHNSYLVIGVLTSYVSISNYFGEDKVVPLYIEVDDGERLMRALLRERLPENGRYAEMCRRFLSDTEDFSEEKIIAAGIKNRYENRNIDECIDVIKSVIVNNSR